MDRGGERGQSVVVGSLLVFTILVLSFSAYQAFAVPSQNAEVEAEHFQNTESQFSQLRSNVINSVGTDAVRSTAIKLGARYPNRMLALNPPPAAGRLETTAPGDVEFTTTTEDVCRTGGTPTTRSLVYTPNYHEYQAPEAIGYENRVISRSFESGELYDQRLVTSGSGNDEISLFLLTGDVSENGIDAYSLEVNGSDRHTTTLTNPIIVLPSRFDVGTWNTEIVDDRSDVTAAPASGDRVTLTFTGGTYDVSCAVVGLGTDPAFTPPDDGGGGSGGGSGGGGGAYGQGSESDYSSENDTETVSVPNGKWNGVTVTDEILLFGGEEVYDTENEYDELEYAITFRNTTTGENYTVEYVARKKPNGDFQDHKVTFYPQDGSGSTKAELKERPGVYVNVTENTTAYEGADLLDGTTYEDPDDDVNSSIRDIKSIAGEDTEIITSEIRGRVDVTIREEALFSAVQPQPSDDPDLEFVRVNFESPTNTTGWQFEDDENEVTTLPSKELSGDIYFAADETAFENERGFADDVVYPLDTSLDDGGDALTLIDDQDRVRDEMAYNGETTDKGNWSIDSIGSGVIAVREQYDTSLQDNDTEADWTSESQTNFFATTTASVAYVPESDQNEIRVVDNASGTVTTYGTDPIEPKVLGPKTDLDADGADEVAYVDNDNNLKYMNADGTIITVVAGTSTASPSNQRALGTGNRDGNDRPDIYYVGSNNNDLYVVEAGGLPEEIQSIGPSAPGNNEGSITVDGGVYGDGDIDGDGDVETIYQKNDSYVGFVNYGTGQGNRNETTVVRIDSGSPSSSAKLGLGEPIEYDGKVQVPLVDGNNGIHLVDGSGTTTQVLDGNNGATAKSAPITSIDWAGDSTLEIVFINGNDDKNLYYVSLTDAPTDSGTAITDSGGSKIRAKEKGVQ